MTAHATLGTIKAGHVACGLAGLLATLPMFALAKAAPLPCSQRLTPVTAAAPGGGGSLGQVLENDLGATRLWGENNLSVLDHAAPDGKPALRATYPADSSSPSDAPSAEQRGGAGFYTAPERLAGSDHACLAYRVRFPAGFDFVKGGKLPGLYGGQAPSGGRQADGYNGFSLRLMWRKEGQGELYTYVLKPQQRYGVSMGRGNWHFPREEWVDIELEARLNTPGEADGVTRVWVDGELVLERRDIIYRSTPALHVDGLMFSTFFGGTGDGWRTPRRQHVDFASLRFYRPAL
ncbi:MAG TPA: hypothetical protein VK991_14070 [Halomonas sp.]|nr:hypothetical protein [Halomonas sp.]